MRLCRTCSYPVRPLMKRCPRCDLALPYFKSRRLRETRRPGRAGEWLAAGKACPVCGRRTRRQRTPAHLRPLKWVLATRFSYRTCTQCGWAGPAFHAARDGTEEPDGRRMNSPPGSPGSRPAADGETGAG